MRAGVRSDELALQGVTLSSEAIASVTSVAAASASASASASVTGTSTVSSAAYVHRLVLARFIVSHLYDLTILKTNPLHSASTSSSSSGALSNGAHGALALIGAVAALAL